MIKQSQIQLLKLRSYNNMDETVTISISEYKKLQYSDILLQYLRNWGVDNWDGFGEAIQEFLENHPEFDD